jgi:hypothetical protein
MPKSHWVPALVLLAMLTSGAAAWFLGLMVFAEEKFCPWCLVAHANGLLSAGLVLAAFLRRPKSVAGADGRLPLARLGGLAAAGLGVLILGQWLGPRPQTHRVDPLSSEALAEFALADPAGNAGRPSPGTADPQGTRLRVAEAAPSFPVIPDGVPMRANVNALSNPEHSAIHGCGAPWDARANPYLGEAGARCVVVEMLDYSCRHCRQVDQYLKQAHQRYGAQFVVVVLPVPLNKDCNEYVRQTQPDHVDACRYARLALAVWQADPKKYRPFHEWLYEPERPPPVADAKAYAAKLVGSAALDAALRGTQVDQVLARNLRLFHLLGEGMLPKLVMGNYYSSGRIQYPETVFGMLEDYLGIRPTAGREGSAPQAPTLP